jgi:transcriptional regulator with PAS, ATPase and Fis domain
MLKGGDTVGEVIDIRQKMIDEILTQKNKLKKVAKQMGITERTLRDQVKNYDIATLRQITHRDKSNNGNIK